MFAKGNVPVLGMIENMAQHVCSACGHTEAIFGADGGSRIAAEYGVPLLASLPLERGIREHTDAGTPVVVAEPDGAAAAAYRAAAAALAVALEGTATAASAPQISITDD